jgi:hypothetical protein
VLRTEKESKPFVLRYDGKELTTTEGEV